MDAESAGAIVNGCAALPSCVYRIEVLAGVTPLAVIVMTTLHLCKRRRSRRQEAARMRQQVEERQQELLERLTFFFSSLRHVYNKYRPDLLPPALQAERQDFLETDFRNITALSAMSLEQLEDLFAAVQRECATGKWREGLSGIERRVDAAAQQANLSQDAQVRETERSTAPNSRDSGEGNHLDRR
jgi:hypothetical protein